MLQAARGAYVAPLSAIYEATAVAIEALGELELVRYDDAPIDEPIRAVSLRSFCVG